MTLGNAESLEADAEASREPASVDLHTELARLRAEIAELRARVAQLPEPDADLVREAPEFRPTPSLWETTPIPHDSDQGHVGNRRRYLLKYIAPEACGLEIGPYCSPTILKSEAEVLYLDYASQAELEAERARSPDPHAGEVAPVDFVVRGEDYRDAVDRPLDYIVANHVMEHVANIVLWLERLSAMLRPGGILFIAIPDKKYNFDRYRTNTDLSHLLADYFRGKTTIDQEHCLDVSIYYDLSYIGQSMALEDRLAAANIRRVFAEEPHIGVHSHVFESETFLSRILVPLLATGLLELDLLEYHTAAENFGEIIFILAKRPPTVTADPERFYTLSPYARPG